MVLVYSCDPDVQRPSKNSEGMEKDVTQSIKQPVSAAVLVK